MKRHVNATAVTITSLDEPVQEAFALLVQALGAVNLSGPAEVMRDAPQDLLAAQFHPLRWRIRAARQLARHLVGCVTGLAPDRVALHDARRALEAALDAEDDERAMSEALGTDFPFRLDEPTAENEEAAVRRGVATADALFREMGLEELDVAMMVSADESDAMFLWYPLAAEAATVMLLERLFQRQAAGMAIEKRLWPQVPVSDWYFERWSAPVRGRDRDRIARDVRANEFRYAERELDELGGTSIAAYCAGRAFEHLPAKQRALALALRDSYAGVFEVERADDHEWILTDARDGRRYPVCEYREEQIAERRFIGLGRILPLGDGRWLRSPGMLLMAGDRPGSVAPLAQLHEALTTSEVPRVRVTPGIAVEGIASRLRSGMVIPREVPPARSAAAASAKYDAMQEHLISEGRCWEVSAEELRALRPDDPPTDEPRFRVDCDDVTAEWMAALSEMKVKSSADGGRRRGGRKGRKRRRR